VLISASRDVISMSRPTAAKAARIAVSVSGSEEKEEEELGMAFKRTEPGKRTGSCGMIFRWDRKVEHGMDELGVPSMVMLPEERSRRRKRARMRDDFPLPVRPHTAIFWPASMEKEMLRRTDSESMLVGKLASEVR
jgi:hypothetical protein